MPPVEETPLMKQYWELKAQAGDALLFFRMGDFYELFADDAVEASKLLEITLTSRDKGKANPMPMAGVPHHSVQGYIQRLLKAGRKVAIGDQVEDPATVKGKSIVRREVTRVFTPAVQFDHEGAEPAYLAVALRQDAQWWLACLDASTGECRVSDPLAADRLAEELGRLPIRHLLRIGHDLPEGCRESLAANTLFEDLPSNYLAAEQADRLLRAHYGIDRLDAFVTPQAAHALGIAVQYAIRTQYQERLGHLRLPQPLHRPKSLAFGPRTAQHLDLVPGADGSPNVFTFINRTRSALGARQLKRWLLEPLKAPGEILARQTAVRELSESPRTDEISQELAGLYDLERIAGRIDARLANPRDTLALGRSLEMLPGLAQRLQAAASPALAELRQGLLLASEALSPLARRILDTQCDDAPLVSREAGIFKKGTSPELDRLITLTEDGQRWLVELETREREATGIGSLKVRYNRVFGYYIEVTQAHLKSVPAHYQRKQTTVGAERFFTEELKKFEDEIVTAEARRRSLELQLFDDLLADAKARIPGIMEAARWLGELDALVSLSRLCELPGWAFPAIDDSLDLEIEAGRHPLVDASTGGSFVPNGCALSPSTQMALLITGPNMGGKSTVMRQMALIVILGQMGAPVPAARARWGAVSSVHTRIGAHDAISRGQSTFMVEMSELAHILHNADERSLIVLDEIGRGTSTYDGISVAWATLEWICRKIAARTLFATHYHELTRLDSELPGLANAHMGVQSEAKSKLRFLYKLQTGPANESFGIHVAKLAGLPTPVVQRAWQVLEELERGAAHAGGGVDSSQLSLFAAAPAQSAPEPAMPEPQAPHPVVEELAALDINQLTPVQALNLLLRLQEDAKTGTV
jgi:DNA mismatch repair protein MutS